MDPHPPYGELGFDGHSRCEIVGELIKGLNDPALSSRESVFANKIFPCSKCSWIRSMTLRMARKSSPDVAPSRSIHG